MKICGLQKLSLLDFPGLTASTVFTGGCNLKCPFCHNSSLVTSSSFEEVITEEEFSEFLDKRKGLIDGICITGGEPLLQPDMEAFISKIKEKGYKVKLDTNGFFPDKLQAIISTGMLDYIAMDIKNSIEKYPETVGISNLDLTPIIKSIPLIMSSGVDYEFRTTIVKEFHTINDIKKIGEMIKGAKRFSVQKFVDSGNLIEENLHAVSDDDMRLFENTISTYVNQTVIKGL